jgi:iron complex outermembrane receptor protein
VGLSAQSYPFPAPTGIVDYRLQNAGNDGVLSVVAARNPYDSPSMELDGKLPIIRDQLSVAAGISYAHEEYLDGANAHYRRAAIVPRWKPTESAEIIPFWSIDRGSDEEVAPMIITAGEYLPPEISRRRFFGQRWADNKTWSTNYGVIGKAHFGADWALAAGVFESVFDIKSGFAEIYDETTPDGMTRELLIADPQQRYASTSGEVRLTRSFVEGPRIHVLHASFRGRRQNNQYGGSAELMDLGVRRLGAAVPIPEPESFDFSERTRDRVNQSTFGLAYEGRWREIGEASLGLQRADYEKRVDQPDLAQTTTRDEPWLVSGTLSAYLTDRLAAYAGYTRGLEENGIAPNDAVNRNDALPAIRSRQMDAGVRWAIASELKLIAGVFSVEKPYFTTDEIGVFTALGKVRHRGVELSLTGAPTESLSIVAGAVLMRPRVVGDAVTFGRVGEKPVGQMDRNLRIDVEYRPPFVSGFSFDAAVANTGERVASRDGLTEVPGYTLVDLGTRYRFKIGDTPATLRVLAENITDVYTWEIYGSNSFGLTDGRRFSVQLAADLYL